ncbi:MAG TPA: ABC transporter ATP-binding protein [Terriglobia bacterium]|nr:ABC transporter ATP-binding protein [Terriglobia bacterium]
MTSPLSVLDLAKQYNTPGRDPVLAVRGISFEIHEGECFGLLGPNGAGKSTSMNCISGFYPATSGSSKIFDIDVYAHPKQARMKLGVCAQEDTLDTDFSVMDQMVRYGTYFRVPVEEGRRRSAALLERFGLNDKKDDLVERLSGGMRRRLQVARALVSDPKVLILDEPTTGLDPEVRRILWDVIAEERVKGAAILLSTHYMEEAHRLCDRVAILHQGKILDCAPPSDLIAQHIGAAEIEEEIRAGVRWKRPPNLEDVYLKLTGSHLENGK